MRALLISLHNWMQQVHPMDPQASYGRPAPTHAGKLLPSMPANQLMIDPISKLKTYNVFDNGGPP